MHTKRPWQPWLLILAALGFGLLLQGCAQHSLATLADPGKRLPAPYPIRFLLTFDDGPSINPEFNPTLSILDDLANNPIQPGIKAVFFVQTRAVNGGGTELGREIMRRQHQEGHLLAFHTATPRHSNHRGLSPEELDQSLQDGIADATSITGTAPKLVRPPYWIVDERTAAAYHKHGLQLLMTHLSANDGKIYGINFSLRRRSNMRNQLAELSEKIRAGSLPIVNGELPIVVTFHDINPYTASHMTEYLEILMTAARELDLPMAAKPFYDERVSLESAALASTTSYLKIRSEPPTLWARLWQ